MSGMIGIKNLLSKFLNKNKQTLSQMLKTFKNMFWGVWEAIHAETTKVNAKKVFDREVRRYPIQLIP
jgi:hypothetical protein